MSLEKILVVASDLTLLKKARMTFANKSSELFTANNMETAAKILQSNTYSFQHMYIQASLTENEKKEFIQLANQHELITNEISIDKAGHFLIN